MIAFLIMLNYWKGVKMYRQKKQNKTLDFYNFLIKLFNFKLENIYSLCQQISADIRILHDVVINSQWRAKKRKKRHFLARYYEFADVSIKPW